MHVLFLAVVAQAEEAQDAQVLKVSYINIFVLIMHWIPLTSIDQIADIKKLSITTPQVIFKHSTRCSISSVAKNRLEKGESPKGIDFYYLDLIQYRSLSTAIAEHFNVFHESPQILLIKNGECIYDESHSSIMMDDIIEQSVA